jgi:hypothetical protein
VSEQMEVLKSKAQKIKGKDYIYVKDRVVYFNNTYPQGSITTRLLTEPGSDVCVVEAVVEPEPGRQFTGHAQEVVGDGHINRTSALENAETSAVGRALAMMGIGIVDSIASVDEMNKSSNRAKPRNDYSSVACPQCGSVGAITFTKKGAWWCAPGRGGCKANYERYDRNILKQVPINDAQKARLEEMCEEKGVNKEFLEQAQEALQLAKDMPGVVSAAQAQDIIEAGAKELPL